jgi:hypothetical protein
MLGLLEGERPMIEGAEEPISSAHSSIKESLQNGIATMRGR